MEKPLKEGKNKNGQSRNRNSNTPEILRGIYSIDPSDEEYKDIIKSARRKLETSKAAAIPCKRAFPQARIRETVVSKTEKTKASEAKTRFSCITEARESTRPRMESVTKKVSRRTHRGKRVFHTLQSCAQICSDAASDEDSRCKGNSGQGMEKA